MEKLNILEARIKKKIIFNKNIPLYIIYTKPFYTPIMKCTLFWYNFLHLNLIKCPIYLDVKPNMKWKLNWINVKY